MRPALTAVEKRPSLTCLARNHAAQRHVLRCINLVDGTEPDAKCQRRLRGDFFSSASGSGAGFAAGAAPGCRDFHKSMLRSAMSFNIDHGVWPSRLFN